MIEVKTKVVEVIQRAPDVKSIRMEKTRDMEYKPGQYMLVTVPVEDGEKTKPLSFSSSPTEDGHIEFTKRLTDSDFSSSLNSLNPGDEIKLKMPYGQFTFEGECEKLAMITGGIGVTPFKSICKYATDKGLSSDIVMLYSNKDEENIAFREEFDGMQRTNKNLRVVYTVTSQDAINRGCTCGRTGLIDHCMISDEILDYKYRTFFISGPPPMVMCLTGVLKSEMGIPDEQIRTEHFVGYN